MKKILMTVAAMAAAGTFGGVFDDCVYWFCGGRDSNGDGFLQSGELTDTMHANNTSHNAHKCTVYGWGNVSGMEQYGVQLREEDVCCPAQGVTNRTMCLYLPQFQELIDNGNGTVTTNYCNNSVTFNTQLLSLLPTNVYTCVMRLRREAGTIPSGGEWFFNCYEGNSVGHKGFLLGFNKSGAFTAYGPSSSLTVSSPDSLPLDCWADISIVVTNNTIRLGIWKDLQKPSKDRDTTSRYTFKTSTTKVVSGHSLNMTMHKFWIGTQNTMNKRTTYAANHNKFFPGAIQQIAFWNRALSDEEVLEAWHTPMADVWRLGVVNNSTVEMGGTASTTTTVDIDAITSDGRWQDVPGTLPAGGTLNLDFTLRKSRFGADKTSADAVTLPQLLCVRTLSTANEGAARVTVNGTVAGTIHLKPNATNTLFLAAKLFNVTGVNRIALTRTDAGSSAIGLDQIKLTGSFQTGMRNDTDNEFSYTPGRCADVGWGQVSDWYEVRNALNSATGSNTTNYWMHVEVPDEAVEYGCTYTIRMYQANGGAANTNIVKLCVNGAEKVAYTNDAGLALQQIGSTSFANYEIHFEPGELKASDNVFWWNQYTANRSTKPPCTYCDFHRFEIVPKPNGTLLIVR